MYGCPNPPGRCRYSDAALVEITSGYDWDPGTLANTVERALYPDISGSTEISAGDPRVNISGVLSELMVGDIIEKIGRTTGTTAGEVQMTCGTKSVEHEGVTYVYLCTGGAFAGMQEGDSGSPVIWRNAQGLAFLVGIAFAGNQDPPFDTVWFNNWHWIDYELGSVTQDLDPLWYGEPPPCQPPDPC